ncbi:MAG TPA: hypothetical protein VJQ82_04785 [Terriglobales bacterium]|nr:hypothetical protein [Terriglobales bacterium]
MRVTLICGLAGSLLLAVSAPSQAQNAKSLLHVQNLMTPDQQQATGVANLTPAQREVLDQWLTEFAGRVWKAAQESTPVAGRPAQGAKAYAGIGSGHWISKNADGAVITLEDGSLWRINPVDRVDTGLWLPTTDVTVIEAKSPVGDYKYTLVDTEDGEEALAEYLGTE